MNVQNLDDERNKNDRWIAFTEGLFNNVILSGEPFTRREAFMWLVMKAAWKTHHVRKGNASFELQRGQVIVARETLAKEWQWGIKKVRNFLKALENENMIELGQQKGQPWKVATVCNYDKYQTTEKEKGQEKGQRGASEGPARGHTVPGIYQDNTNRIIDDTRASAKEISQKMIEAGGDGLDPIAAGCGMQNISDAIGWINDGADLNLDILPTVRQLADRAPKGSIRSWNYFRQAVSNAKDARERGLPEPAAVTGNEKISGEEWEAICARVSAKYENQEVVQ